MTTVARKSLRTKELDDLVVRLWSSNVHLDSMAHITRLSPETINQILVERGQTVRVYQPCMSPEQIASDRARWGLREPLDPDLTAV